MQASSPAAIMACDSQPLTGIHCPAVCNSFHGKQSVVKNCNDRAVFNPSTPKILLLILHSSCKHISLQVSYKNLV